MAKKKTNRSKKPANRVAKKVAPSKPKAKTPAAAKSKPRGTSVDSLLKKFNKERKTQEAKLAASLKKIDEMEKKAAQLRDQIAKTRELAKATQNDIDQLESRRDAEVAEVLASLGVQLSTGQTAAPEPRPVLTLGQKTPETNDDDSSD